jgi:hypothetical protein
MSELDTSRQLHYQGHSPKQLLNVTHMHTFKYINLVEKEHDLRISEKFI